MPDEERDSLGRLNGWLLARVLRQWVALMILSVALAGVLSLLHMPAAVLLGCMGAAGYSGMHGWQMRIPGALLIGAQGVVGCMIARTIVPGVFAEILGSWPIFLVTVLSVIAASTLLGWLLARRKVLPGTTAMWGLSPGGATAVILQADSHGADVRLVALMQYLRIAMVALLASVVSWIWGAPLAHPPAIHWFPAVAWPSFVGTLAIILLGGTLAGVSRIPAGALLIPLVIGLLLQNSEVLTLELPPWLLLASFAVVAWSVGLRFTRSVLKHCAKALPSVLLSVGLLIALCGGLAALLTHYAGVDPLTAYLATSPGGVDSVAIIAASAPVDVPFVMALQTVRFLLVLVIGPFIAITVSKYLGEKYEY